MEGKMSQKKTKTLKDGFASLHEFKVTEALLKLKKEGKVKSKIGKDGEEKFSITEKGVKEASVDFLRDFGTVLFLFKTMCSFDELKNKLAADVFDTALRVIPLAAKRRFVDEITAMKVILRNNGQLAKEVKFKRR